MKIALAQVNTPVGDLKKTSELYLSFIKKCENKADLLCFPEGGLLSYPLKDFLFSKDLLKKQDQEINHIQKQLPKKLKVLLPAYLKNSKGLYNGVYLLEKGKKPHFFKKEFLPNESIFFESRYFKSGKTKDNSFTCLGKKVQILICEDFWQEKNLNSSDVLICLNSSPYTKTKQKKRLERAKKLSIKNKSFCIYLNRAGAQDEIIFDGGSFILNETGSLKWQGGFFKTDFTIYDISKKTNKNISKPFLPLEEQKKQALILGIKEFCTQLNFSKIHLGLSGGIDSALVLYLSVQALGAKNVKAFFLPTDFTSPLSYKIVKELTSCLKVSLEEKNIQQSYKKICLDFSKDSFKKSVTPQNLQARLRTLFLMFQSNESSSLLMGTGNKSELATGYSTLYGDLAGGLLPIGDLWKTEVYQLCRFINKKEKIFGTKLLLRPPTAELAFNQKDEEHLLPYKELDTILENLLLFNTPKTKKEKRIAHLLNSNEFKRQQSPPVLKISDLAFGDDRRMPIAHKISF